MRPEQWIKNLFVLTPIVFSKNLFSIELVVRASLAFFLFCFVSSAVYLMNDVVDRQRDRQHPVKCRRAIASGKVSPTLAISLSIALAVGSLTGALVLHWKYAIVAVSYLTINVIYTFALKHLPWLDVLTIATGFLLRVMAGGYAISVGVSHWLLICTFLLAFFLGLGKRQNELLSAGAKGHERRKVLKYYSVTHLKIALIATAGITVVAYIAYTLDPRTIVYFGTRNLIFTVPFIFVGIARYLWLIYSPRTNLSPTEEIVRDVPFLMNLLLWAVIVVWAIYG